MYSFYKTNFKYQYKRDFYNIVQWTLYYCKTKNTVKRNNNNNNKKRLVFRTKSMYRKNSNTLLHYDITKTQNKTKHPKLCDTFATKQSNNDWKKKKANHANISLSLLACYSFFDALNSSTAQKRDSSKSRGGITV